MIDAKTKAAIVGIVALFLLGLGAFAGYRAGDGRGRSNGDAERSALNTQLIEQGRVIGHFEAALADALARERRLDERLSSAKNTGLRIAETAGSISDRAGRIKAISEGFNELVRILDGSE